MIRFEDLIKNNINKPWVSPFEKIIGIYSAKEKVVQIYEYHARNLCYGAAAWAVYHYKRTSPLMVSAVRDGVRDIFILKLGKNKLDLKPSYSSAGIEEIKITHDNIQITYSGLAGGGVGSTLCRAMAKGVKEVIIHEEGGGDKQGKATLILPKMLKIQVGMDDTDRPGAGATWSLANEIGFQLGKDPGIEYLNHTLVQLFPGTPEKTTNCVGTVLTFAIKPELMNEFKKKISRKFELLTLSNNTALAFWEGIVIPNQLVRFSNNARKRVVTITEAIKIADRLGIELVPITGERGIIGAVASIGYAERQDLAIRPAIDYKSSIQNNK